MRDISVNKDLRLFLKSSLNELKFGISRFSTLLIAFSLLILFIKLERIGLNSETKII
jgi:hypothetical protein